MNKQRYSLFLFDYKYKTLFYTKNNTFFSSSYVNYVIVYPAHCKTYCNSPISCVCRCRIYISVFPLFCASNSIPILYRFFVLFVIYLLRPNLFADVCLNGAMRVYITHHVSLSLHSRPHINDMRASKSIHIFDSPQCSQYVHTKSIVKMKSFAFLLMAVVAVHVSGQAVIEPSCGENEESTECVGCRRTCEEVKPPICNKMCSPGCDCVPGYYRNVEGECVDMSKCK